MDKVTSFTGMGLKTTLLGDEWGFLRRDILSGVVLPTAKKITLTTLFWCECPYNTRASLYTYIIRCVRRWEVSPVCTKTDCFQYSVGRTTDLVTTYFPHCAKYKKELQNMKRSGHTWIIYVTFIIIIIIDRLYTALYSPLSSRLTALACDSTWVNSFL